MEQIGEKVSIDRKYTQLQAASFPFIIFNSSKHKKHFGTVMLVQMQLSPTLSDQNKTVKY